jgi:hypothetical protein
MGAGADALWVKPFPPTVNLAENIFRLYYRAAALDNSSLNS